MKYVIGWHVSIRCLLLLKYASDMLACRQLYSQDTFRHTSEATAVKNHHWTCKYVERQTSTYRLTHINI